MPPEPRKNARLFAAIDARIPTQAPEPWRGLKQQGESLPDFFRRVWGAYLPHGLRGAQIRRMDAALWKALDQHILRAKLPWPDDLVVPGLRPKKLDAATRLDQGRWRELSDDEIIAALIARQRDQLKQQRQALRSRRSELRKKRAALKAELRRASQ